MQNLHWHPINKKTCILYCKMVSIELFVYKFENALAMQQLKHWLLRSSKHCEVDVGDLLCKAKSLWLAWDFMEG